MPDADDDLPPKLTRWRDGRVWLVVGAILFLIAAGLQGPGTGDRPRFVLFFVAIP